MNLAKRSRKGLSSRLTQRLGFGLMTAVALLTILPIVLVVAFIIIKGAPAISWEFLTQMPRDGMRAGGGFTTDTDWDS